MKNVMPDLGLLIAPADREQTLAFLEKVQAKLNLSRKHTELLLQDHLAAIAYYLHHENLSLTDAIARLDPAQLGDFYFKERTDWYPLDHAAKIYPLSMSQKRMMVFRVSGYLHENVVPEIMQMALTYTMKRFPCFATTIKSGFFWHYLDSAMRRFVLKPEVKLPCSVMRVNEGASPALRVVYFENRVSVEFCHLLADGTGAYIFLRTLLREYLRLLGHDIPTAPGVLDTSSTPNPEEWQDSFTIGDRAESAHGFAGKRAIQLRGMTAYEQPSRILHYNLPVDQLRAKAKSKGVTVTALLLAYVMLACKEAATPENGRPHFGKRKIQIQLPVNMRKYYPSETLRNFAMYCSIALHPDEITTVDDMLPSITAQLGEGGSKERLDETMHLTRRLVRLLRFVPLMLKRPIAYLVYGTLSDTVFTTTFTNLGVLQLPPEMSPFVDKFDAIQGPPILNRATCAMCSFENKAVLTITKNTTLTLFEDALYRLLMEDGFTPYMEGSC